VLKECNLKINGLSKHKELIFVLTKKEILGRYRGSSLGILWSLIIPITMLIVYTFVFSSIFNAKWPGTTESKSDFALLLFAGLIVFNLMAECINRSPNIIFENVNYVKKVVFPLGILPIVVMLTALFHAFISLFVWIVFYVFIHGFVNWTIILIPIYLVPLILFILGCSYLISSITVYFRDIGQAVGIVVTLLMFLSPIFYPAESVPEQFQLLLLANPIAPAIEDMRQILYWGQVPAVSGYIMYLASCFMVFIFGFMIFNRLKKGFADVL